MVRSICPQRMASGSGFTNRIQKNSAKQPSIWGILIVEKNGNGGNFSVNHPCRSKKRNDKRAYIHAYMHISYILCICIYKKIRDSLFNTTILEICAERHKKRIRFSQIMPLQRTHTVLNLEIYYSLFQPSWCP